MSSINRITKNRPRALGSMVEKDFGIYIGEVVSTKDVSHTGMIQLYCPELAKADRGSPESYFPAFWSSPFAGTTNPYAVGKNIYQDNQTQKSYGFWSVPPDAGNKVLFCFADGNKYVPVVISCLYPDQLQFMVPGNAAGVNHNSDVALPVAEKNPRDENQNQANDQPRPINTPVAQAITQQGLINDEIRGISTSSARRESPSRVFGWSTPGPPDPESTANRLAGHSFVMDDNPETRNIRIRSAGGNQILLDDTEGFIYIINRDGTSWVEMAQDGSIHVFSNNSINMRAKGNFNLRADNHVNIEAGKNIRLHAQEGSVRFQSAKDITAKSGEGINLETGLDFTLKTSGATLVDSGAALSLKSSLGTIIDSGRYLSFRAGEFATLEASGIMNVKGTVVNLNNGGSTVDPLPVPPVDPLALWAFPDLPPGVPEFVPPEDANTVVLPTNGERPGNASLTTTIVDALVTAEPWFGHDGINPIPVNASSGGLGGLGKIAGVASQAISVLDSFPAPTVLPDGTMDVATGFTGEVQKAVGEVKKVVSKVNNMVPASARDFLKDPAGVITTELTAAAETFLETPAISNFKEKFVGFGHKLNPFEEEFGLTGFADGKLLDFENPLVRKAAETIRSTAKAELANRGFQLLSGGEMVSPEGFVFGDLVEGISSSMATGLLGADLNTVASEISQDLGNRVLSDNQFNSLTSFARDVGMDKWYSSDVRQAVLEGDIAVVPNLMTKWSFGSTSPGSTPTFKQAQNTKRQFEARMFSLPDEFKPEVNTAEAKGLGYGVLNAQAKAAQEQLVEEAQGTAS